MSHPLRELYDLGQSIWCDNLSRHMLDTGELARLIDLGVVGVTSNPTIFMKAITGSADYDARINRLSAEGLDTTGIYEGLVLPDIADAADLLKPVHERTDGIDGYVSLEVNPKLAYDTDGTIEEARRLFAALDRRNVLIKVPATDEGLPAIETLIAEGINVNVTLIFSGKMHERVMNAYLAGLRRFDRVGGDLSTVASVASFFVSRVDTLVDKRLEERRASGADVEGLLAQAAIANARLAYARFAEVFDRDGDFASLAAKGARVQRPLWASTSTKNSAHKATMYVDALVGRDTVNTLPPKTLQAVLDGGTASITIGEDLSVAKGQLDRLEELGISLDEATDKLRVDGVNAFADSFDQLFADLDQKREQLRAVG